MDPGEFIQVNAMARVDLEAEIELSKINLMYCGEHLGIFFRGGVYGIFSR